MTNIKFRTNAAILSTLILLLFTSCVAEKPTSFEESKLYGKWVNNTEYQVYKSNGTGYTWDTADDVTESEAQPFNWTLEVDILTHIHIMEMTSDGGGSIPKIYTVTELSETTLCYEDSYGKVVIFRKVDSI